MHFVIVGNGNMANLLQRALPDYGVAFSRGVPKAGDELLKKLTPNVVAIHVGSGRELPELMEFCFTEQIPIIQASSGKFEKLEGSEVTIIDAPNLASHGRGLYVAGAVAVGRRTLEHIDRLSWGPTSADELMLSGNFPPRHTVLAPPEMI